MLNLYIIIIYPRYYDACDAYTYFRAFEQSVPEVYAVPKGHKVSFYLNVVPSVQPVKTSSIVVCRYFIKQTLHYLLLLR